MEYRHAALRPLMVLACLFLAVACTDSDTPPSTIGGVQVTDRPNFLFVVFEDLSPRIGAYGDKVATTPVLDAFAQDAILFTRAFTTAGVCAPSRSSLMTGVHQQVLGTQHMRTRAPFWFMSGGGPIEYDAVPPPEVKAFPELLRAAGYYTTNNDKTDYQFGKPFLIWDDVAAQHPWRGGPENQPFFAMVNIRETHESYIFPTESSGGGLFMRLLRWQISSDLADKQSVTDPSDVEVPSYLPDTPIVRADIARHYDNLAFVEQRLQSFLDELEQDGLLTNTIIVVTSDHGDGLPRAKRSLYDSGLHVPLMVRFPNGDGAGDRRDELVSFVDLAPTFLSLAGAAIPAFVDGRIAFGPDRAPAPPYIFAAADRHDSVQDRLRAVRDERWKYIRNYRPEAPFFRHLAFRDNLPTMQELWRLQAEGGLTPIQAQYFTANRSQEELYDTNADPDEVNNLAADPAHAEVLVRLRSAHEQFMGQKGDLSSKTEAEMIEAMWPNQKQPTTQPPDILVGENVIQLVSPTNGASIGFQRNDADTWHVYTAPIPVDGIETIRAKAIRYGYKESAVVTGRVP